MRVVGPPRYCKIFCTMLPSVHFIIPISIVLHDMGGCISYMNFDLIRQIHFCSYGSKRPHTRPNGCTWPIPYRPTYLDNVEIFFCLQKLLYILVSDYNDMKYISYPEYSEFHSGTANNANFWWICSFILVRYIENMEDKLYKRCLQCAAFYAWL